MNNQKFLTSKKILCLPFKILLSWLKHDALIYRIRNAGQSYAGSNCGNELLFKL